MKRKKLKRMSSGYFIIKGDLDVRLKLSNIEGVKSFSKDEGKKALILGPRVPSGAQSSPNRVLVIVRAHLVLFGIK